MPLETSIEVLNTSINRLISALEGKLPVGQDAPAPAPADMPPPPSFLTMAPTAPPPAPVVPFTDAKGLLAYVMAAFEAHGGAKIQEVFNTLKLANVNDVKPDQYQMLYQAIEALKA